MRSRRTCAARLGETAGRRSPARPSELGNWGSRATSPMQRARASAGATNTSTDYFGGTSRKAPTSHAGAHQKSKPSPTSSTTDRATSQDSGRQQKPLRTDCTQSQTQLLRRPIEYGKELSTLENEALLDTGMKGGNAMDDTASRCD